MWLGLDFSGDAGKWTARCSRSNVWLATLDEKRGKPVVRSIQRVQEIAGDMHPFDRLANYLAKTDFACAGIDAPFALPKEHMPIGGHAALLKHAAALLREGRPFAKGAALVEWANTLSPLRSAKPLRETERKWRERGLNVRSTLWNGPRGGAPFTAACLTLLHAAGRPCYPWAKSGDGMMLETFPMAQLAVWNLPYVGYDGDKGADARQVIVASVSKKVEMPDDITTLCLASADALDAVLCATIARAWSKGTLLDYGATKHPIEGWIVVGA